MWLIEALKQNFEVTVMTTGGWDLAALNAFYGTRIDKHEVKVRIAPIPLLARSLSAAALRGSCYQRFARKIAAEFDLRISAYNPTDWGLPAIHFLADFSWDREIRELFDPKSPGFVYRDTIARKIYLRIASAYSKPSGRDILHEDLVIANSHWSAALMKEHCGVNCAGVVYPPVWTEFPEVPWEEKEQAFAMIGRIAPEKRVEDAIAILKAVRHRGHAVRLHLCGQIGSDLYGQRITDLCNQHSEWIVPEGRVSGAKKAHILTHCRFGIQTRAAEPFGISVAEMIKAGAIVFAPSDGGQAEILDSSDPLFSSGAVAVEKIIAVLGDPPLQSNLRAHLANQAQRFSAQNFVHDVRTLIVDLLTTDQSSSCNVMRRTQ
jgi:glycosyltransferase involved in cell wall biosynthesis